VTTAARGGRHQAARGRSGRRPGPVTLRLLLAAVAGTAALLSQALPAPPPATPSTSASGVPVPVSLGAVPDQPGGQPAPTRVRVPTIEINSGLVGLGVDDSRTLVPPEDFAAAGWFTGGAVPGAIGPAVIAGHVDSHEGPAVFFRLSELEPGDEVLVDRADGTTVAFTVTSVGRHPKDAFPTEEVYGPTPRAELRLITCGGEFDSGARSYRDNVVVHAEADQSA
jgi:sortase (surface protein transpeptidase)